MKALAKVGWVPSSSVEVSVPISLRYATKRDMFSVKYTYFPFNPSGVYLCMPVIPV